MTELPLYTSEGKSAGSVSVDEKLFGDRIKKRLLQQVVVIYEANRRQGNASTKIRNEVSGSRRKPWPQKHTGMARVGDIRSPLWRHGGIVFGPRPRDYRRDMTASMRRAALNSALLGKIRDKEIHVIEGVEFSEPKTRRMAALIKAIGFKRTVLLAVPKADENVWRSARNLQDLSVRPVAELNAYEVLKHKDLLLTREALEALLASRRKEEKP